MSRRNYNIKKGDLPNPLYYFPFTSDNEDIMGNFPGWRLFGANQYGEDGVVFNGLSREYCESYNLDFENIKTFAIDVKFKDENNDIKRILGFEQVINRVNLINTYYARNWSMGFNLYTLINGVNKSANYTPFVLKDTWYRICCVNGEGSTTWYVNGVKTGSYTNIIIGACVLCISKSTDRLFNGNIKNLKIYNRALTAEEVAQL